MENKDYVVKWSANGLDFNYGGQVTVWSSSVEDAKNRAIQMVADRMVMSRHLIQIEEIKEK